MKATEKIRKMSDSKFRKYISERPTSEELLNAMKDSQKTRKLTAKEQGALHSELYNMEYNLSKEKRLLGDLQKNRVLSDFVKMQKMEVSAQRIKEFEESIANIKKSLSDNSVQT